MSSSPTRPWFRKWFGTRSERAAARFLRRLGYRIVTKNWACKLGEIDLVALDGQSIVFVEVRSTGNESTDGPLNSIDSNKQRRLTRLALAFMRKHDLLNQSARFDVIAISWPDGHLRPRVEHFANAFEAVGEFEIYS